MNIFLTQIFLRKGDFLASKKSDFLTFFMFLAFCGFICWIIMDFLEIFLDFSEFLYFYIFLIFLQSYLLRLLLKVTEVTIEHQKLPKININIIKRFFFAQGAKKPWPKPSAGHRSKPA